MIPLSHGTRKKGAHQDDIKRLPLRDSSLESIYRQTPILRDLDRMSVLLKYLDRQLLVDEVVLGEEDVEHNVIWCRNRADRVGLQSGDQRGREILSIHRSGDLRTDAIVKAPLD